MRILISGSSGTIGKSLYEFLVNKGYRVYRLIRVANVKSDNAIFWNPSYGILDESSVENFD
ncbi:MAG: TIGR01777 family protein, partial [Planctomycetota bacterium]